MDWTTCPGCGLKHSPRADGLCPRCRTRTGAGTGAPAPSPLSPHSLDRSAFGPPSPFDAPGDGSGRSEPLPTSAWGGGAPLPTTPVGGPAQGPEVTVGSLVNRTFRVWWANFGKFLGSVLIAYAPLVLVVVAAGVVGAVGYRRGEGFSPAAMAAIPVAAIAGIGFLVLVLAQFGGVVHATLQHLAGKRTSVGAMFGVGLRRAWPLFVAGVASGLLVLLGSLALIVPGIILALGLSLAYAIVVAEGLPAIDAMKRSFALTKGKRGTILGALFVVGSALWAASLVGNLTVTLAPTNRGLALAAAFVSLALQLALTPLTTVAMAVAYHDIRVAKEGVDTSELARVFE